MVGARPSWGWRQHRPLSPQQEVLEACHGYATSARPLYSPEGLNTSKPSVHFSVGSGRGRRRKGIIYGPLKRQGVESSWEVGLSPGQPVATRQGQCVPRLQGLWGSRGGCLEIPASSSQSMGRAAPGGLLEGGAAGSLQTSNCS